MDANQWLGEPRCLINRSALLHNTALIRKAVGPHVKICAMVKADAYGHGAALVADTLCRWSIDDLEAPMVDCLAVADLEEAAALADLPLPILVLRPLENIYLGRQRARLETAIQKGWTLTLCSPSAADDLGKICLSLGRRASVQVMIDTGMTRAGVSLDQFPDLLQKILSQPFLRLSGVYTHFSCAEERDNALTADQLSRFNSATADLRICRHAANSAALFADAGTHLNMVRPGISLYGVDPLCRPTLDRPLRPVMKWTAPLIDIRDISAGTTIGYGQSFIAPRAMRIGLVPVGYADGYLRAFSNRAVMLVHGRPAPAVGRVSMDLTTIDLTQIPQAALGDEAIVLDSDPLSPASVYKLSEIAQTIPYEILCRIGTRVKRVWADDPITMQFDEPAAPDISADGYSP
ncbi:MAG TPA: alanine racemase [Tepidisphaeraceae bacterium]|nr:alanine racemase [Tepidisphaeraceae bacterium]